MSQSSFVLEKDLQFIDVGFLAKVGDVFVFTPPQTMVVYRNGDIQINMAMTQAAIDGLLINGSFKRIQEPVAKPVKTPAPVVVVDPIVPAVTELAPVVTEEVPVAPEVAPEVTEEPVVAPEETGAVDSTPEAPAPEEESATAPKKAAKKSKK